MVAVQKLADGSVNKLAHHGSSRGTWGVKKMLFKVPAPGFASVFALPAITFLLHPLHNEAVILLRY